MRSRQEKGIEPDNETIQALYICIETKREWFTLEEIIYRHSLQWQSQKRCQQRWRVCHYRFRWYLLNHSIVVYVVRHAAHIKAVHILPEVNVLIDIFWVAQWCDFECAMRGYHEAIVFEIMVASPDYGVKHGFVEEAVAHPF